jgi:hypothetical protein
MEISCMCTFKVIEDIRSFFYCSFSASSRKNISLPCEFVSTSHILLSADPLLIFNHLKELSP